MNESLIDWICSPHLQPQTLSLSPQMHCSWKTVQHEGIAPPDCCYYCCLPQPLIHGMHESAMLFSSCCLSLRWVFEVVSISWAVFGLTVAKGHGQRAMYF